MKKEKTISVLFLVQSAMIAAIYVVLTIVFAPISFGQIQYRRSTDHPARLHSGCNSRTLCGMSDRKYFRRRNSS